MQKKLSEYAVGESGIVKTVGGEMKIKCRLLDMGITPGVKIQVTKKAPMGDPIEISIRSYQLSLRTAEAEHIVTQAIEQGEDE